MSRKLKRADHRAPTRRPADPATAVEEPLRRDERFRVPGAGSWLPLVVAVAVMAFLVLLMVIANLDSPPQLTEP